MLYISTRGGTDNISFRDASMGVPEDGGLLLPQSWPQIDISNFSIATYQDIAFQVMNPLVGDSITPSKMKELIGASYGNGIFVNPKVTPVNTLNDGTNILELFHGPTAAFKDVGMQWLGNIFGHFLQESGEEITVLGATSGDTGSAAIAALANKPRVKVFILLPQKGPSDIQRKQMTCVDADNVWAIRVAGDFDDCQRIVKQLFNDSKSRERYNFAAVNSINWARIQAQIVYYFAAAAQMTLKAGEKLNFVVPSGNFGDAFAAYAAKRMGAPIGTIVVATNENDVLHRFLRIGTMARKATVITPSPSMDIQVSSNFERYLSLLLNGNAAAVKAKMAKGGEYSVTPEQLAQAQEDFLSGAASNDDTLATIAGMYKETGYLIDPHTAAGIFVKEKLVEAGKLTGPTVCLATASPCKFPDAVLNATGVTPPLPQHIAELTGKPERNYELPADAGKIEGFMRSRVPMPRAGLNL